MNVRLRVILSLVLFSDVRVVVWTTKVPAASAI
jgi:hypothetical protein